MIQKLGRPKIVLDVRLFEELCRIHCTKDEICHLFKVDEKTLTRWCKDTYEMSFSDIYKTLSSGGKMSLRRAQWKSALNGNTTMLVWLGKQELGQKDKSLENDSNKSNISFNMNYGV